MGTEQIVILTIHAVIVIFITAVFLSLWMDKGHGGKIPKPPRKLKPKAKPSSNWDVMLINVDDIDKAK